MDTVIGKQKNKPVLLVLTERMTRPEYIFKMASKSEYCAVKTIDKLEKNSELKNSAIFTKLLLATTIVKI